MVSKTAHSSRNSKLQCSLTCFLQLEMTLISASIWPQIFSPSLMGTLQWWWRGTYTPPSQGSILWLEAAMSNFNPSRLEITLTMSTLCSDVWATLAGWPKTQNLGTYNNTHFLIFKTIYLFVWLHLAACSCWVYLTRDRTHIQGRGLSQGVTRLGTDLRCISNTRWYSGPRSVMSEGMSHSSCPDYPTYIRW